MFRENDVKVVAHGGTTRVYKAEDTDTASRSLSMKPGEPVKVGGTGSNFAILLATGDPESGTDEMLGIVRKESTETASVDGEVEVVTLIPVKTVLRAQPTTSTSINTQVKLDALKLDWVSFDLTALAGTNGIFTIDADEGSDVSNHGLQIIDGDINTGDIDVITHGQATSAAPE